MQDAALNKQTAIWQPSEKLSPRVRRLRDEYFSFRERDYFRNEVRGFTTGKAWDAVWSPHAWSIVPESFPFFAAFADSLLAGARTVPFADALFGEPLVVRRALFFREVVTKHLPIKILDGELIVGSYFNTALSYSLNKSEAREFKKLEERFWTAAKRLHELGVGNCGAISGHIIPNYKDVLTKGFAGVYDEIKAQLTATPSHANDVRRAMMNACEAARDFAQRYADEAEKLAAAETDPARQQELQKIAAICRRAPWQPARTFYEAVQSLWFAHMLVMAQESYPGPGLSHGRIDQYLYPFYQADLDCHMLDRNQAKEILECFWIKHNYAYDYQGRVGPHQGIVSGFGQLITLGGIDQAGLDASNELTWLMLEVIDDMNLLEPKPNVRLHENTPDDLLREVARMIAKAQGSPFLLNFDENAMRGLEWEGLPKEQLWDYAPVGCLENTLQGNDRSGTVDVNLNLAKAVELALNDGQEMATGERLGPATGDPRTFRTFDDFRRAFERQLDALVELLVTTNNQADEIRARFQPTPYLSTMVDGCAQQGRDVTEGGARHNYITVEGVALATTIDSLLAVKKLVFEDKKISMDELLRAIADNFQGHAKTQALLQNKAPKFGNDNDEADALAQEVSRHWTEKVADYTTPTTGKRYRGGYLSWNYWVSYAPSTAATPDGRPRGKFLSNGVCPVTGMDLQGPTANIRSVGKLSLETAPNGGSHTISLSPSLLRDEEHVRKLMGLLRAYGKEGGTALQINVIDADTLRRAQDHPEEFRNLLVRVTGYNAYFVMIGKEIQDEIISRESHKL
jgi:formate C-acetyltransferase